MPSDETGKKDIESNDTKDGRELTRRDFVKLGGISVAAGVALSMLHEGTKKALTGKRYAMVIDLRRCVGCMSCQVSCKMENDVPLKVFRSWVKIIQKGKFPDVKQHFLPRLCNHCDNPPCVSVCPTKASYKRENDKIVLIDTGKCIGCGYCIVACPYDARFKSPVSHTVEKCTFCNHRIEKGLDPTCVRACMGKARTFGDIADPESKVSKVLRGNNVDVLKAESGTEPKVFYIGLDKSIEGRLEDTVGGSGNNRNIREVI